MPVPVYQSVNVSIDPALKERVLNRTINMVKCPRCDREVEISSNLLYHDMKRKLMVWLRLDKVRDGELQMKHHTLRIVHDYPALVEKIRIFDTEIDDCVLELLKFVLWPQASGKKPEEYQGDEIRFIGMRQEAKGEHLFFQLNSADGVKGFSFPKAETVKMVPVAAKVRAAAPEGNWLVVDRDFILAAL